jgi:hypothetical protein
MRRLISGELANYRVVRISSEPLQMRSVTDLFLLKSKYGMTNPRL